MAPTRRKSPRYKADCANCALRGGACVPGYGPLNPYIMFVAEAPGQTEEDMGKPLIGKAGQFLRMVIRDLGIDENDCYFTNVCLCKPPGNRKPKAKEAKACMPRLIREISAVKPRFIVALGGTTGTALMKLRGITTSHGAYRELKFKSGFTVGALATYHPSGVLRAPDFFIDFVEELERVKNIIEGEAPVVEPPYENYEVIDTQERYDSFLKQLHHRAIVAVDLETDKMSWHGSKILCAGFSWKRGTAHIVDWEVLLEDNLPNIRAMDAALKGVKLSFQNGLYDVPFFYIYGIFNVDYYLDTMIAHYLLDERQGTHGLEHLTIRYYHSPDYKSAFRKRLGLKGHVKDEVFAKKIANVDKHDLFMYNGADVDYTYRLTIDLPKAVRADGQIHILRDIEMPSARTFLEFTWEGMPVDQQYWRHMAAGWRKRMKELEVELRTYPGVEALNFASPKQVAHYLFDTLGLLPFGGAASFKKKKIPEGVISKAINEVDDPEAREYWTSKRTQMSEGLKGFGGESKGLSPRSTTTYMLYFLRQQHPFPGILIEWKSLQKRYSMYWTGIKDHMWADGRVHPKYKPCATRTGRKATEDPAMHNLPRGDEIYNIYVAPPGWVNIHADYMTAEMRMMAHYSKVKKLQHLLDTTDIHTVVAKEMFGLSDKAWKALDKTTQKNMRIAAKMLSFGIPYGRSANGIAPQLGVTIAEAEAYLEAFLELTGLKPWLTSSRAKAVKRQYAISEFGRKRRFPFIRDKYHRKEVSRQAGNMPIQSAINDLTLIAWFKSIARLRAAGIPCKPWPHIHDSLNIIVPETLWRPACQIINDTMEEIPFETHMTFPAEIEVGRRWGSMATVMAKGEWNEEGIAEIAKMQGGVA